MLGDAPTAHEVFIELLRSRKEPLYSSLGGISLEDISIAGDLREDREGLGGHFS